MFNIFKTIQLFLIILLPNFISYYIVPILLASKILESYSFAIHVPLWTCMFKACLQNNFTSLSEMESEDFPNCRNSCNVRRHTASASTIACL